ncbi:MAG: amidohydrolase family protein [Planctomycetia bacterium]|jgi:predicted TIM-barrel fold metal-dependent hydrolase|nr:amidohydrolase family protein [Planctomycetia bacterium]
MTDQNSNLDNTVLSHNRLGINYRDIPQRKISGLIIDAHTHTREPALTREFLRAADAYGIGKIWTMAPLEQVDALRAAFPGRFEFIAIPNWKNLAPCEEFITDWRQRIDAFYARGIRLIKFHNAPGTQQRMGMTLDHPEMQRMIHHAYKLGYHFMTHVGDPRAWFGPGRKYDPKDGHRSFNDQFAMLDRMLEKYPDRVHLGAHIGGSVEALDQLQQRLDRFPHYIVDCSATKWIVRGIAEQPLSQVREFFIRNQDRILFGSDLVVGEQYDFDHYASRYWVHQKQWETDYHGDSPIADPDAVNGRPELHGLNLPVPVLEKLYHRNAEKWLFGKVLQKL